ncbi:hypothetical protein A210_16580 [Pseudomonas putida SJTE-1]|uniref:hypothetical protein n=1 Tax=Pseudomonas putida group TaxID=136845 RepID=UPI0007DD1867|nr:hypothetical protein [Pseudomonas putida]ANI04197.1 hypothetical protein A210_16580 [Pseudomonas putida SJTE-1]
MNDINWAGCPEATHFDPVDQNFLREVGEALLLFNIKRGWTVPLHTAYGLHVEECNRPLIKRPEWNGEGLPPVGTVCEFAGFNPEETLPSDPVVGDRVTVIAHFKSGSIDVAAFTFFAPPEFEYLQVGQGAHGCFRPIRTPEQIAEEEREKAITQILHVMLGHDQASIHEDTVQALCAKRVYDAGYRKQEAS